MLRKIKNTLLNGTLTVLCFSLAGCGSDLTQDIESRDQIDIESSAQKQAFFGDLHVHTLYSGDAFASGVRTSIDDAYRYARGKSIEIYGGRKVQLDRPLDFMAVTDHGEGFAEVIACSSPDHPQYGIEWCQQLRSGNRNAWSRFFLGRAQFPPKRVSGVCPDDDCHEMGRPIWKETIAMAEKNNIPGTFTSFIGYEYSPAIPRGGMMHRNVIFGSNKVPDNIRSAFEAATERDLWSWLDSACDGMCEALTIPHNLNYSWGLTFAMEGLDGIPYTDKDKQRQRRRDRVLEIFQIKGSSECAFGVGAAEEACAFEQLFDPCVEGEDRNCALMGGDVRTGLQRGLTESFEGRVNTFQMGFIGGTDTHNGTGGSTNEYGYEGAIGNLDSDRIKRLTSPEGPTLTIEDKENPGVRRTTKVLGPPRRNPGGLAGVWANENTREGIFGALTSRETFATSGPRMTIRMFAADSFPPNLFENSAWAEEVGGETAPMGSSLQRDPEASAPSFAIEAVADVKSAKLHRLQIVKVVSGEDGPRTDLHDVACAEGEVASGGKCAPTPIISNIETCAPATGGVDVLRTVWTDPDYDPKEPSFYYARAFEVETCRWTTLQAIEAGMPPPRGAPTTIQERAWSSPIWVNAE